MIGVRVGVGFFPRGQEAWQTRKSATVDVCARHFAMQLAVIEALDDEESGPCPGLGVAVGVSVGKAGAALTSETAANTSFAEKHGAVEASSLMRKPPTPALNGNPARLVSYTITTAVPLRTVNPSLGAGAQTVVS